MSRKTQVFVGFKNNNFALTKTSVDSLDREPFHFITSLEEVDPTRPCLFPMPAHYLWNCRPNDGEMGYIFRLMEEGAAPFLALPNMILCLDGAGEGFPLDALAFDHMTEQLARYDLPRERVLFLTSDLLAPQRYTQWCAENGRAEAFRPVSFDVQLYFYSGGLRKHRSEFERLYYASLTSVREHRLRARKYLSFNYTPRPTRIATPLLLMQRNLLDEGFLSYHGRSIDHGPLDPPAWASDHVVHEWMRYLGLGASEIELLPALEAKSPMLLDEADDRVSMAYGMSETRFYLDSYFSIVTETVFEGPGSELRVTEKTWKPFAFCHIMIAIANPGTLAYLRSKGFKTFHPYINEEYDTIQDPALRYKAVWQEIMKLCAMSHEELHSLYTVLWPTIIHNFLLFHYGPGEMLEQETIFQLEVA